MDKIKMLEIAELPLARRMWQICKLFKLPLNDPRIQEMDIFDIEFYEMSQIVEDPDKLERYKNHYYDPEFDEWMEEFEEEQRQKAKNKGSNQPISKEITQPIPTTEVAAKNSVETELPSEEYEYIDENLNDWEEVSD